MSDDARPIAAKDSVGTWLKHPRGGPLLRDMLAAGGMDEKVLRPVRMLSLQRLVKMSDGRLTQDVVDDLVARANDPTTPLSPVVDTGGDDQQEGADEGDPLEVDVAEWQERLSEGRFEGQTIIVTGAGSGIGRATASRLAREGARVIAVDIAEDRLAGLVAEQPGVVPVTANITREHDIARVVAMAGERIDGLANVAGIADNFAPLHEVTDDDWQRIFSVNVEGLFRLTRAVLPAMIAAGRGSIVNVASEAALTGSAAGTAYTASKHAVIGITRSAAFMYGPSGIRVNAVAPGGVATGIPTPPPSDFGMGRLAGHLRLIPPIAIAEQLAASITFLLSEDGTNVNGAVLPSDGGWSVQ